MDTFTGGSHAALRRLRDFVQHDLARYETKRNHPEVKGTSRLSPYLHFGNIGPVTIALACDEAVQQGRAPASARDRFLDELIGWRELSSSVCPLQPQLRQLGLRRTVGETSLREHAGDPRPQRYTLAQLERGETYDELWNAAQREMVLSGWMHNYMRMYWAKKILEWAPDPATAFDWAVTSMTGTN